MCPNSFLVIFFHLDISGRKIDCRSSVMYDGRMATPLSLLVHCLEVYCCFAAFGPDCPIILILLLIVLLSSSTCQLLCVAHGFQMVRAILVCSEFHGGDSSFSFIAVMGVIRATVRGPASFLSRILPLLPRTYCFVFARVNTWF